VLLLNFSKKKIIQGKMQNFVLQYNSLKPHYFKSRKHSKGTRRNASFSNS